RSDQEQADVGRVMVGKIAHGNGNLADHAHHAGDQISRGVRRSGSVVIDHDDAGVGIIVNGRQQNVQGEARNGAEVVQRVLDRQGDGYRAFGSGFGANRNGAIANAGPVSRIDRDTAVFDLGLVTG